jgi:uncharacterized protein YcbK (DUF882 family)
MHVRVAAMLALSVTAFASSGGAQILAARTPLPPDTAKAIVGAHFQSGAAPAPADLRPLLIRNANTGAEALVGLYTAAGEVDEAGVAAFCEVAGDAEKPAPLKTRVLQLVVKAAYELGAKKIVLVSTYRRKDRRGRGGYHSTGEAVDFRLPGIPARKVASYLRKLPRAGVGIYTHPKTQFVHLDAREQSFHWLDASPPGRRWREAALKDRDREARDASWRPSDDLPKSGGA